MEKFQKKTKIGSQEGVKEIPAASAFHVMMLFVLEKVFAKNSTTTKKILAIFRT